MAISDQIQKGISKARDVAGVAGAVADFPGVPAGIRKAIKGIFNTGEGLAPKENRRDMNNLISNINRLNSFTKPNYFYVEIFPPPMMANRSDEARSLAFLTESATLPGISLATSEIRRYGTGPLERKPYSPVFVDTTLSFFVDGSGVVQNFFNDWINGIIMFDEMPYHSKVPQSDNQIDTRSVFNPHPFGVNYKENYATDMLVTTVDESNNDIVNVRFRDIFPIFMGDIGLSWGDNDNIARLPIMFTYFNWKIERINVRQIQQEREESVLQKLIKVGNAVQVLGGLRKPQGVADVINVINNTKIAIGGLR